MSTITLWRDRVADCWQARFTDPEVRDLFNTDTLPTAFRAVVDSETVRESIASLNPESIVMVEPWSRDHAPWSRFASGRVVWTSESGWTDNGPAR